MRCSARGEGAAGAAVAAAGPPISADDGTSAPSRPLGILSAHAVAQRGAQAAPTASTSTAPVRTGQATAAAATTAGVACPPELSTTAITAGASAKAGLRVSE